MEWHQQQQYHAYVPWEYPSAIPKQAHWTTPVVPPGGVPGAGAESTQLGRLLNTMAAVGYASPGRQQGLRADLSKGLAIGRDSKNQDVQKIGEDLREYTWHLNCFVLQSSLASLRTAKVVFRILSTVDHADFPACALAEQLQGGYSQRSLREAVAAMATSNDNALKSEEHLKDLFEEASITEEMFKKALQAKEKDMTHVDKIKERYRATQYGFEGAGAVTSAAAAATGALAGTGAVAFGLSTAVLMDLAGGCGAATGVFALAALFAYWKRVTAKKRNRRSAKQLREIEAALEETVAVVAALYGLEAVLLCVLQELDVILRELVKYGTDAAMTIDADAMNVLVRQADWLYNRCTDFEKAVQDASHLLESELKSSDRVRGGG